MKAILNFRLWSLALVLIFGGQAFARPLYPSAKRLTGEHWTDSYRRVYGKVRVQDGATGAVDVAVEASKLDSSKAFVYAGTEEQFEKGFYEIRDLRFLLDPDTKMTRRLSWMYPDDGCFIRAEWMAKYFTKQFNSNDVNKIFAFGDLNVKTKNHPSGKVSWWYHVVVGWRIGAQIFVYDPAIEPLHPLALRAWLSTMGPRPDKFKVAICRAGTYSPSSECAAVKSSTDDKTATRTAQEYLHEERARLLEMKRSPEKELGDSPPWLKSRRR